MKPRFVDFTRPTSGWTSNYTWVEQSGYTVCVHVHAQGIPSVGKVIASGLPVPKSSLLDYSSLLGVLQLDTNGNLSVISAATTSSTIGETTITYLTEYSS